MRPLGINVVHMEMSGFSIPFFTDMWSAPRVLTFRLCFFLLHIHRLAVHKCPALGKQGFIPPAIPQCTQTQEKGKAFNTGCRAVFSSCVLSICLAHLQYAITLDYSLCAIILHSITSCLLYS